MWYAGVLMTGIRRLVAKRTDDSEHEQVYHREASPSPWLCRRHGTWGDMLGTQIRLRLL
jgi:hypothetical protein